MGNDNQLYGVTPVGGAHGYGVLFSITPQGIYTDLHDFAAGTDGNRPFTLLLASNGTLVGSTELGGGSSKFCVGGCGTLFEYVPVTGQYTVPFSYTNAGGSGGFIGSIGAGPTVYGVTEYNVYSITAAAGYADIGDFNTLQLGSVASGPLLSPEGALLGVNGVGPNQNVGSVYSEAGDVVTTLALFGGSVGSVPSGQPVLLPGNKLIGTTSMDGLCAIGGRYGSTFPSRCLSSREFPLPASCRHIFRK